MALKTPLYDEHILAQAKMVDFSHWLLPVEFAGVRKEHLHVRQKVGLFDVSHMGEIRIQGSHCLKTLEWLLTNTVSRLKSGQAQYSLMVNEKGGIVDDLVVYCLKEKEDYLLCVNASNKDKNLKWIKKNASYQVQITDESSHWGQIALQGPRSLELACRIFPQVSSLSFFSFACQKLHGCIWARTGYTGELGFEIFVPWDKTSDLWKRFFKEGVDLEVAPIGLGARDTLRLEMCYSLYGNDIDETTNPYEAGLSWVVKDQEKEFLGRKALLKIKTQEPSFQLVPFKMKEGGIPRKGYSLFSFDKEQIGKVTSGTLSPCLGVGIGLAYVRRSFSHVGVRFYVQIRERQVLAEVVKRPFLKKQK